MSEAGEWALFMAVGAGLQIGELRRELVELQERVDFAERLLTHRNDSALPPAPEGR